MFEFTAYKLIIDILAVHGFNLPVSVDRSTLWRWRDRGHVPPEHFYLAYYYGYSVCRKHGLYSIDLKAALDGAGYDITGLLE